VTVYCNITECKNWLPLKEVHHMENKPGFKPIGKTDEYTGQCAFKSIKIEATTARSPHTKQVLAVCGSYNAEETKEFQCLEERCKYFIDPTTCDKVKHNENLYIDWTVAFDELERKEVPRCKTFAHRWRENAIDWAKVAQAQR